jgi:hypothetical protein
MGESAAPAMEFVGRIHKGREEGAEYACFFNFYTWALLPERLQRPPSIRSKNKFRPKFKATEGR